jgi:hypothetical protein
MVDGAIRIRVHSVRQLFNSFDPSPFLEKDLDDEAEDYIVGWAGELPPGAPLNLVVHLPPTEMAAAREAQLEQSLANYFTYRAEAQGRHLSAILREGRWALAIGMVFLVVCTLASEVVGNLNSGPFGTAAQNGLAIFGWVANWRPAQIFLYDWWPIARRRKLYRRLARMTVELRADG